MVKDKEHNYEILPISNGKEMTWRWSKEKILNEPFNISVAFEDGEFTINRKIRPVNGLDKNTSGIVIFAKNEYIQEMLIRQMKMGTFQKEYIALLEGNLKMTTGTIQAPIARKENSIIERQISDNGAQAISHYQLLKNYKDYCLVKFLLETRTNTSNSSTLSIYWKSYISR